MFQKQLNIKLKHNFLKYQIKLGIDIIFIYCSTSALYYLLLTPR